MKRVQSIFGDEYLVHALAHLIYTRKKEEAIMLVSNYDWDQRAELIVLYVEKYGNLKDIIYLSSLYCEFGMKKGDWNALVTNLLDIKNKQEDHDRYDMRLTDYGILRHPVPERAPQVDFFIETGRDIHPENWVRLLLYYINVNDLSRALRTVHFLFVSSGAWNINELEQYLCPFRVKPGKDLKKIYKYVFNVPSHVADGRVIALKSPFGVACTEIARKYPFAANIARMMLHSQNLVVVLKCVHLLCLYENNKIICSYYEKNEKKKPPLPSIESNFETLVRALPPVASTQFVSKRKKGYNEFLARTLYKKVHEFSAAEKICFFDELIPAMKYDPSEDETRAIWKADYTQLWDEGYAELSRMGQTNLIDIKYHPMDADEYMTVTRNPANLTKANSKVHWFVDPENNRIVWYGPMMQYPNAILAQAAVFRALGAVVPTFNVYKRNNYNFFMVSAPNLLPDTDDPYPRIGPTNPNHIDKKASGMHDISEETQEGMIEAFKSEELLKALLLFWTMGMNLPKGDDVVRSPNDGKWYILGFHKHGRVPNALGSASTLYQLMFYGSHDIRFAVKMSAALAAHKHKIRELLTFIEDKIEFIKDTFVQYGCSQRLPPNMYERLEPIRVNIPRD